MISIAVNTHQKARLQFYAAYIASIILILAIFSLLWKDKSDAVQAVVAERPTAGSEQYVKTAAFLHGLLKQQESLHSVVLTGDKLALERLPVELKTAQASLDSVVNNTAVESDGQQAAFRQLYSDVRQLLRSRSKMVQDFLLAKQSASQPVVTVQQKAPEVNAAQQDEWNKTMQEKEQQLAGLQKQLQEERADKEKRLSELRNQLAKSQQNTAAGKAPDSNEWKQKFNTMKNRHSELNTAYNSLSRAYQNVVADNRKLYGHIKSLQKQ